MHYPPVEIYPPFEQLGPTIGHFRVPKNLTFKARLSAKPLLSNDAIKTYFRYKSLARSLVLRVRFFGTRKWPIVVTTFSRMATLKESSSPALRKEQLSATSEKFKVPGKNYSRVLLFLLFLTFKKFLIFFCMNQFGGFHRRISISQ